MYPRIAVALLAFGGMSGAAHAGITVYATIDGQVQPACANAEDVVFTPATTLANMRFSYLCPADGVQHTCTPAETPVQGAIQPGTPFFSYNPSALSVTIVCTGGTASGLEVWGTKDGVPITGCNPATNVVFNSALPVGNCVAGAVGGTAACVQFQCPQTALQGCFPIEESSYDFALRRVEVTCETQVPLAIDGFE